MSTASCAWLTAIPPRSESDRVAVFARTFATLSANCDSACASCASAAISASRAASAAKYCCLTWSARFAAVATVFASAAFSCARAARMSYVRRKPSNRSTLAEMPVVVW